MKKVIWLLFFSLLVGCDDRLTSFQGSLGVDFSINGGALEGSVKMGLKSGGGKFALVITTTNVSDIKSVRFEVDEGNVEVYQSGQLKSGVLVLSSNMELEVRFLTSEAATITVVLVDQLGGQIQKSIRIVPFANLPPVAALSYQKLAQNDPREYELNGSTSFDQDAAFGGDVSYYEWTIGSLVFTRTQPITKYIFSSSGTYVVRLRVADNDGAWSEQVTANISVN